MVSSYERRCFNILAFVNLFPGKWQWQDQCGRQSALIKLIRSSPSVNLSLWLILNQCQSQTVEVCFPKRQQPAAVATNLSSLWQIHFIWKLPSSLNRNPEPTFTEHSCGLTQIGLDTRRCISHDSGVSSAFLPLFHSRGTDCVNCWQCNDEPSEAFGLTMQVASREPPRFSA